MKPIADRDDIELHRYSHKMILNNTHSFSDNF